MSRKRKGTNAELDTPRRRKASKQARPSYTYTPLEPGEIRLLNLCPGEHGDPLHGTLETFPLEEAPDYRAISYAWGPAVFQFTLHLSTGDLAITESLHGALRRFRDPEEHRWLWADAVCISQEDADERNAQVGIMGQLYRRAEEVWVWLDEAKRSDILAFFIIDRLATWRANLSDDQWYSWETVRNIDVIAQKEIEKFSAAQSPGCVGLITCPCCALVIRVTAQIFKRAMASLSTLFARHWFERLWVVQEIMLAQKVSVHSGSHKATIEGLYTAALAHRLYLDSSIRANSHLVQRAYQIGSFLEAAVEGYARSGVPRIALMTQMAGLLTSEPRDRIYAITSVAFGTKPKLPLVAEYLTPDYSLSLPALWARTAVCWMACVQDIGRQGLVLALAGLKAPQTADHCPSWSPDFNALTTFDVQRKEVWWEEETYGETAFMAGGPASFAMRHDVQEIYHLHLQGTILEAVTAVLQGSQHPADSPDQRPRIGGKFPLRHIHHHIKTRLLPWYSKCALFASGSEDWLNGLCEDYGTLLSHGTRYETSDMSDCILPAEQGRSALKAATIGNDIQVGIDRLYRDLRIFLRQDLGTWSIDVNQILARTEDGRMGWVPSKTRPGDRICLFQGVPFPFIVRDLGDGFYELIGDAYVQGIMHGEAWPKVEADVEEIHLR